MTARRGRPLSENPRTAIRKLRLTPDEDAVIVAAAARAGMNLAAWMRTHLLAAAKRQR